MFPLGSLKNTKLCKSTILQSFFIDPAESEPTDINKLNLLSSIIYIFAFKNDKGKSTTKSLLKCYCLSVIFFDFDSQMKANISFLISMTLIRLYSFGVL